VIDIWLASVAPEFRRRRHPINMVLLAAFTLCWAFMVGMICSFWDVEAVALAFICTCAGVLVLALIATQVRAYHYQGTYVPFLLLLLLLLVVSW
jgi:protein lifeguard